MAYAWFVTTSGKAGIHEQASAEGRHGGALMDAGEIFFVIYSIWMLLLGGFIGAARERDRISALKGGDGSM